MMKSKKNKNQHVGWMCLHEHTVKSKLDVYTVQFMHIGCMNGSEWYVFILYHSGGDIQFYLSF